MTSKVILVLDSYQYVSINGMTDAIILYQQISGNRGNHMFTGVKSHIAINQNPRTKFFIDNWMLYLQVLLAGIAVASVQLVTNPNGAIAPAKTPEVLAAEAAHFGAHGYLNALDNSNYGYPKTYPNVAYNNVAYNNVDFKSYSYAAHFGNLVAHLNRAIDIPDFQAAPTEHFDPDGLPVVAPYIYTLAYAGLVAHPNGTVVPFTREIALFKIIK